MEKGKASWDRKKGEGSERRQDEMHERMMKMEMRIKVKKRLFLHGIAKKRR